MTPEKYGSHVLHVGRPNQGERAYLHSLIDSMLDRNWLTNDGPLAREFEQRIAKLAGARHCVVMCNATVAMEIAIRAAGLTGEVIVPAYTFVATAHALQWQHVTPVFCDIDPITHNIDPACIERLITPRTSGIIGVHIWGCACDITALTALAERHNLKLMFDAAHAFGCSYQGQPIGSFGLAEVFSFHATKFIQSGEGGAVVTNDDALADKMRLMRNFGFLGYDNVAYVGTNGKMNELAAAMGLTSLASIDSFIEVNRRNYRAYKSALSDLPGVSLIEYSSSEHNNYQYVVLDIAPETCPLTRDQLVTVLHEHGVLARRYFYPGAHRMQPYRSYYPNAHLLLPVTEAVAGRVIVLPTGAAIDDDAIRRIADVLKFAIRDAAQWAAVLPRIVPPGGDFRRVDA